MYRIQTVDQNAIKMYLLYRDFSVVFGLLFFQSDFWGDGPARMLFRKPVLGRTALPLVVGMGLVKTGLAGGLFSPSGCFRLWDSVPLA